MTEKILELVALADRELNRLEQEELRLMPTVQRLKEVLEEKKRILEAQVATLQHVLNWIELHEKQIEEKHQDELQ